MSTARPDGQGFVAGTVAYLAPEVLCEQVRETSRVSEMYSFGVTVWECLTGKVPHAGKKEANIAIFAATKTNLPMLNVPSFAPMKTSGRNKLSWQSMQEVAELCLSRDRKKRPTASRVVRMWRGVVCQLQITPIPVKPPQPNMEPLDPGVRCKPLPTQPVTVAPSSANSSRLESHSERLAPAIPPNYWQQQPQSQPFSLSMQGPPPPYSPSQPYQQQQQQAGVPPLPYEKPQTIQEEGATSNGCVTKQCLIIGSIVGVVVLIVIVIGAALAGGGGGNDDGVEAPSGTPRTTSSPTFLVERTSPPSGDCDSAQSAYLTCQSSLPDFGDGCAACLSDTILLLATSESCTDVTNGFCRTVTRSQCKCNDCLDVMRVWFSCILESPGCISDCDRIVATGPTPAPTTGFCQYEQSVYSQCVATLSFGGVVCQSCALQVVRSMYQLQVARSLEELSGKCSAYDYTFCSGIASCECGECADSLATWINCGEASPGCIDC